MSRAMARPSPDPPALQIAALVQAMEGPERFLAAVFGNAGPVIFDDDLGMTVVLGVRRHRHLRGRLQGIVDQIGDAAAQRRPFH